MEIYRSSNWDIYCSDNILKKGAIVMDVDLIFKIAGLGILISILNKVLIQSGREEQAQMITLVGVVIIF